MEAPTVVLCEAPAEIRALSPVTGPDYLDHFVLTAGDVPAGSAERWARVAFEDVAGVAGQVAWRGIVGLRLTPGPDRVAGWRVAERGDRWVRLEARGWMLTAHVVFHVEEGRLSVATFIRYDRRIAAVLWPPMAARHRRAVPRVLVAAYRVAAGRGGAGPVAAGRGGAGPVAAGRGGAGPVAAGRGEGTGAATARLPAAAHTAKPWRIHDIAPEFRVEDVWALPTPGGPDDLARLVNQFAAGTGRLSGNARLLFAIRRKIGAVLGWDRPGTGVDARVPSLRARLPADLRDGPAGPDLSQFRSVYLTDTEWAAEIANRTVHAVLHVGWVGDGTGAHHGQLAVLVKPNGLAGRAYMAAIAPFRHRVVYPALLRSIGRTWRLG